MNTQFMFIAKSCLLAPVVQINAFSLIEDENFMGRDTSRKFAYANFEHACTDWVLYSAVLYPHFSDSSNVLESVKRSVSVRAPADSS